MLDNDEKIYTPRQNYKSLSEAVEREQKIYAALRSRKLRS